MHALCRWFLHQWERLHSARTISHGAMSESSEEEEDTEDEVEFEDDLEYLRLRMDGVDFPIEVE